MQQDLEKEAALVQEGFFLRKAVGLLKGGGLAEQPVGRGKMRNRIRG